MSNTMTPNHLPLISCLVIAFGASGALADQESADRFEPIKRSPTLPETTPWDLGELSKVPKFEWGEKGKGLRGVYYQGEPYRELKETRVFAYYSTPGIISGDPSRDKNLPAVIVLHGGGANASGRAATMWAKRGYAALAVDLRGCGPGKERMGDGGPDGRRESIFDTIEEPVTSQWVYHAVANTIRANSLLRSFPEVDPNRVALTGVSWGGYITCNVAGLDNRLRAAVPVYGCGFIQESSPWVEKEFDQMSQENRDRWATLWDPSRYIGSTTVPILFVNGASDGCYRNDSYAMTYSLVKEDYRNIRVSPKLRHSNIYDRPREVAAFINHQLKGEGAALAKITSMKVRGDKVIANVESKGKLVSATLHYLTRWSYPRRGEFWHEVSAAIDDKNQLIADLPPKEAVVWMLNVIDERGVMVSSEIQLPHGGAKEHEKLNLEAAQKRRTNRHKK